MSFHVPEQYRWVSRQDIAPHGKGDPFGCFLMSPAQVRAKIGVTAVNPMPLVIIATDGLGEEQIWEHVSVSTAERCPTWPEMALIKSLFWDPEDCVIQYHPPESQYVDEHPYCLHLWRPRGINLPTPPSQFVGNR